MDQEKIGKFIADIRKKKHLTQEEIANKLGITSKAVSKWETGKGLPDVSLYVPLCEILGISLNEFFAGQYLNKDEIKDNAEKNILNMANQEHQIRKKLTKVTWIALVIIASLVLAIIFLYNYMSVARTFELNWGVILPNDFKEEYHVETAPSFHGDGVRYSVFKGNNFMTDLNNQKNEELELEIKEAFKSLNIPETQQIDFSNNYSWTKIIGDFDKRNYMYIIYDKEVNKFYFYEFLL